MKQASVKSNQQKQASNGNDTPIGAMSVVSILKELATPSKKTLYNRIQKNFNPLALRFYTVSISTQNTLIKLLETHYLSVDTYLASIQDNLINYMQNTGNKNKSASASSGFVKILNKDNFAQSILLEITGILQTIIAMQESVMKMLSKIYTYLPELKTPVNVKTVKSFNQSTKEYIEFLKTLGELNKIISKDFVERFTKLTDQYVKFVDKKNTSALVVVGVQLTRFTKVLSILGIALSKTRRIFRTLTLTLILLSLAITMPPFSIAMMMLFTITYKLQATFNPKFAFSFTRSINAIRNALIGMVLAMFLMSKINIQDFYKVIGCMIVMAGVIKLLTKAQKTNGGTKTVVKNKVLGNNSGNTTISGLGGLAFGIAAIVLALNYVKTINWSGVTALVIFLGVMIGMMILASKQGINWGPSYYNKRTQKSGQSLFDGLFKLSIGLAILVLCVDAANEVNWAGAGLVIMFIASIGLTLWATAKVTKQSRFGGPFQGIFGFAAGVALLILCADAVKEVDWFTAGKLVLFIAAISFAIHAPEIIMGMKGKNFGGEGGKMSGMFGFALGLALIILAMDATKEVNMKKAFQIVLFIGAMVFITNKAKGLKNVKQLKGGIGMLLMMFGATVFVIALASKIINPGPATVAVALTIGTIYGMGYTIRYAYDKLGRLKNLKKVAEDMAWFSIISAGTIIALSMAITNPTYTLIAATLMFTVMIGTVKLIEFINEKRKQISSVQNLLISLTGFLTITIGACYIISLLQINLVTILIYVLSTSAMIGLTYLAGKFSKQIEEGAISLIFMGIAMLLIAYTLHKIMTLQFNLEASLTFVGSIILMAGICAILGIPAVAALVGVGVIVLLGLSISLLISAFAISLVTQLNYNTENITNFSISIELIAKVFGENIGWIIIGLIGSVLFLPIAITSIVTATALILIALIPQKPEKIKQFGNSIVNLVEAYNKLGLISTLKASAKALLLVPISVTTLITALALRAISVLDIDENKIDKFGTILSKFIIMMCDVVNQHAKEIENNKEAFKIVATMATAAGSIVNVVEQMANMTVGIWKPDPKTGELKIMERRQINENDFKLVSENMGKVMAALIAPLSIIASDNDEWDFGNGIKVPNPFSKKGFFGNDDMSGINRLKAIGDAFEKIPAIMQGFTENPLLTDVSEEGSAKMQKLQENIGIFFDTIVLCMNKLPQKSVLDNWFDGTADWLKDTVQPVFTTSGTILNGLSKTLFWKVANAHIAVERVGTFWSTTKLMLDDIEIASKKKFDNKFADKVIQFYNKMNDLNTNSWLNLTNMDSTVKIANASKILVNTLADTKSFNTINKNLQNTNKNITTIVGNINKIQIPKAQILEKNLKLLTDAKSVDQLKEVIEHLKEMIGMLKEVQEEQVKATQAQTTQQAQQWYEQKELDTFKNSSESDQKTKVFELISNIYNLLDNGVRVEQFNNISEEIIEALDTVGIGNGNSSSPRAGIKFR